MTQGTPFNRKDHNLTWIRVGDLHVVWTDAQRALGEAKAKDMAAKFDPHLFGTLTVSVQDDGRYHVDDGWTRAAAMRMLYGDNEKAPCVLVPAKTAEEAARIFYEMNSTRSKPSAMERFKVGVTAKYPDETTVNEIVRCQGLTIELSQADGAICAVSALLTIYRRCGEDGLRGVLEFIKDTWAKDNTGFNAHIMLGVALFLAQPDIVKPDKLVRKLARKFTPGRLLGAAKASREAFGGSMPRAVAAIIQEVYAPGGRVAGAVSSSHVLPMLPLVAHGPD